MQFRRILLSAGVVPALAGVALLSACGGDDDGGSGSDEDFVADLCGIFAQFNEDLDNLDPEDISSEEDVFEALAEPFEAFADDFKDLNPPSDLEDWHNEAGDRLDQIVDQINDGEVDEELLADDDFFPTPPEDAANRLQELAEENDDCQEADFNFEE